MIIGVLNQKGGVGKTTLSINLAAIFSRNEARVLLIDADPQGSALDWASARNEEPLFSVIGLPRATDLARSAIMASDLILISVQPSPYDIQAADEIIKLINEALIYKQNLKSAFVINRKILNTEIGRDVREALEVYSVPSFEASITQRVFFAKPAAQGKAVCEIDEKSLATKEIKAVVKEIMEFLK